MKKCLLLYILLFASISNGTTARARLDQQLVADMALSLSRLESPQKALEKYQARLKPDEIAYLKELIAKKMWLEMPQFKSETNIIKMTFSNKKTLEVQVDDYWAGVYSLDGYKLEFDKYPTVPERMAYLRRVIQSQILQAQSPHSNLFLSLFFNKAQASLTCNALVSSGCIEVSMAASLWLLRTAATDSPISRCDDIYFKNVKRSQQCIEPYKASPTLIAIQEMSEMLVQTPQTSVKIICNNDEGPTLLINDTQVTRLNRGASATDYDINSEQDKDHKLRRLPEVAIRCCKKVASDVLAGQCEDFVNSNLGLASERNKNFRNPDIRLKGKALEGTR